MTYIVGIGGPKGHGKNTLAEFLLQQTSGEKARVFDMSAALFTALYALNPYVTEDGKRVSELRDELGGDEVALKTVPEVRRVLQCLGTDVVRNMIDADAWVKATKRAIVEANVEWAFLTGIRFPNELALADASVYIHRGEQDTQDTHISERALGVEDFDYEVANVNTLDDLRHAAAPLFRQLHHRKAEKA